MSREIMWCPLIFPVVLTIIVQKGNPKNIISLEDLTRPIISVGIADPEAVCIGLYAK